MRAAPDMRGGGGGRVILSEGSSVSPQPHLGKAASAATPPQLFSALLIPPPMQVLVFALMRSPRKTGGGRAGRGLLRAPEPS